MTELIANGLSKSRSASLTGTARSMIYYQRRNRKPQYDADLERRISDIVTERSSYGTRMVTAMIRRSGSRIGRNHTSGDLRKITYTQRNSPALKI